MSDDEFGTAAADIITNRRLIKTSVLAGDKQIVVLGGLIRDEIQETNYSIPILGQLPIIGRLFRHSTVQAKKTNLLVFIRPTIIRTDSDMSRETAVKYQWIREHQLRKQREGVDFVDDDTLPLLPTWEEQLRQHLDATDHSIATESGTR